MADPTPPEPELSFEDALKQLETIVHRLESGDEKLDDAIRLYAEGNRLKQLCEARLDSARAKIERIVAGGDGRPQGVQPFDAA
ncbi:exodeoxyribonuclease VII small subunit [Sphingomonas sp. 1P06PA]|uniref:exodeoxyribonuclease VII small subunit n=1 Tax=Sphingomonas sp. 1P06PA TaxID=554121 RepID=UPI0039A6E70A